jgi:hypothetical protein
MKEMIGCDQDGMGWDGMSGRSEGVDSLDKMKDKGGGGEWEGKKRREEGTEEGKYQQGGRVERRRRAGGTAREEKGTMGSS